MQRIPLRLDALEVESFEIGADRRTRGGVMYAEGPHADNQSGNDHCTGPTNVVVTCASCGDDYDTCFDTCVETCEYTCEASCIAACPPATGSKLICPEG